jgi:hypothetical protein
MMKENVVGQIDMFLNVLPVVVKKSLDNSNSPIMHFFRKEYETAHHIQNSVRHQLLDLKKYCESGDGYTNEVLVLKENILKGILKLVHFRHHSSPLARFFRVPKVICAKRMGAELGGAD